MQILSVVGCPDGGQWCYPYVTLVGSDQTSRNTVHIKIPFVTVVLGEGMLFFLCVVIVNTTHKDQGREEKQGIAGGTVIPPGLALSVGPCSRLWLQLCELCPSRFLPGALSPLPPSCSPQVHLCSAFLFS